MIDTTTLTNRQMRYKEYERLRNVPEIEMAMTVYSDEACVAGDTKIATPFGLYAIKELAEKEAMNDSWFIAMILKRMIILSVGHSLQDLLKSQKQSQLF
jgi:hypothetical protein